MKQQKIVEWILKENAITESQFEIGIKSTNRIHFKYFIIVFAYKK